VSVREDVWTGKHACLHVVPHAHLPAVGMVVVNGGVIGGVAPCSHFVATGT